MNQIIFSKVRKQPVKKAPEALLEKMGVEVNIKRNGAFVIDQDSIKLVEFNDETGEVRITLKEAPLAYMDTPQPKEEVSAEQSKEGAEPFTPIQPFHQGFKPDETVIAHAFNGQIKSNLETHCPTSDYPSFVRNTEIEKALVRSLIADPQGLTGLTSYSVTRDLEKTAGLYKNLIETLYKGPTPTNSFFKETLDRTFLIYNRYVLEYPQLFGNFETIPEHDKQKDIFKMIKLLKEIINFIIIYKYQL